MWTLTFLAKKIVIYFGIPCFLAGIIGGFFNITVFFSLHTFRQSSCAFYLTIMSIFNIIQMLTGLLSRILTTGFNIDWTEYSIIYCKFKYFSLQLSAYMSTTCLCLATIDQYFITSTRPYLQQWCQIKRAHYLILICILLWSIEQFPTFIYYNHSISSLTMNISCIITNDFYEKFNLFFNRVFLWYSLPILINIIFGILAYRNIQQITYRSTPLLRRELDKQLTMMVFIQVLLNFLIIIPSLIIGLFILHRNSIKDPLIILEIQSANAINSCVFYLYFASPFYIYMSVSERFRRQFFYVIFEIIVYNALLFPTVLYVVLDEKYSRKLQKVVNEESRKYAMRWPIGCTWQLKEERIQRSTIHNIIINIYHINPIQLILNSQPIMNRSEEHHILLPLHPNTI